MTPEVEAELTKAFVDGFIGKSVAPTPIDELFRLYQAEVKKNLIARIRFGEHQRLAFKTVVGAEIERLRLNSQSTHS